MAKLNEMKEQYARLTATVMQDAMRGGFRMGNPEHIELNKVMDDEFEEVIECSTDLPADAFGEVASLAMQKAWKAGCDPIADRLVVVISFEVIDGKLNLPIIEL